MIIILIILVYHTSYNLTNIYRSCDSCFFLHKLFILIGRYYEHNEKGLNTKKLYKVIVCHSTMVDINTMSKMRY